MSLQLDQFDYHLPQTLIAQVPAEPRDSSKLLVLDRQTGRIEHHYFHELDQLLSADDVLVRNNTKVIPARLFGKKTTGGEMEILLVKPVSMNNGKSSWQVISKPGLKIGQEVSFQNSELKLVCQQIDGMTRIVEFNLSGSEFWQEVDKLGQMPLPPYIHSSESEIELKQKYQTIYAQKLGSVAAPTAGLHFTKVLDERLRAKGIEIVELTLHVGLGTFLPVKEMDISKHQMHGEWFEVNELAAEQLTKALEKHKRIIAVGTTSARTLETIAQRFAKTKLIKPVSSETSIFIYPPYKFKFVDALITNFHLPKSTLLMMISAFSSVPNTQLEFIDFQQSLVGKAYAEAIKKDYRFYSFGDAMMIKQT